MITYIFINGIFSEELSDLRLLPEIIRVDFSEKKLAFYIPKNIKLKDPIHLHFVNQENQEKNKNNITHTLHTQIFAAENSYAAIIEEYSGEKSENYTTNYTTLTKTEIYADKNAQVHYCKIQQEALTATHTAHISIQQKQDSCVKTFVADFGGLTTHENIHVNLAARGASCHLHGLYYLKQDKQQLDNHIHVDHIAELGSSVMLYKGILDNKTQAVFTGKVYVHQDAQRINAQQGNHNLLLSPFAEVKTKPELEIYADDVKCTHGATVGQLDEDALFYLCARGIEKQQALKLLTVAFATDVIDKIDHLMIKNYLQQQTGYANA